MSLFICPVITITSVLIYIFNCLHLPAFDTRQFKKVSDANSTRFCNCAVCVSVKNDIFKHCVATRRDDSFDHIHLTTFYLTFIIYL